MQIENKSQEKQTNLQTPQKARKQQRKKSYGPCLISIKNLISI